MCESGSGQAFCELVVMVKGAAGQLTSVLTIIEVQEELRESGSQ